MTNGSEANDASCARRPWLRLALAYILLAAPLLFFGFASRAYWGATNVATPFWASAVLGAVLWFVNALRSAWANGAPNYWSALWVVTSICLVGAAADLLFVVATDPELRRKSFFLVVWFTLLCAVFVAPFVALLAGAWRVWRRPWLRIWAAFLAIVAIDIGMFGLGVAVWWNDTSELANVNVVGVFQVLAVLCAPLWAFIVSRPWWRDGARDYWGAVIAAGSVNFAACALAFLAMLGWIPTFLRDGAGVFVSVSFLTLTAGSLLGGGVTYLITRRWRRSKAASVLHSIENLPRHSLPERQTSVRDVSVAVRVRERLDVVNALFASVYGVVIFFGLVLVLAFAVETLLRHLGFAGIAPATESSSVFADVTLKLTAALLGVLFITAPLAVISRIHRRVLAVGGVLASAAIIAFACWRVLRFWNAPAGIEEAWARLQLAVILSVAAAPTIVLYGALCVAFLGLAFSQRRDFLAGRGERPGWTQWVSQARRMLGMPNYVGALGRAQVGVTLLFLAGAAFGALWVVAPFALSVPLATPGAQYVSILPALESQMHGARAMCGDDLDLTSAEMFQFEPDAAMPPDGALTTCVVNNIWALGLVSPLMYLLAYTPFALLGLALGRMGQRAATRAYQHVREWDKRAPIVYLRAFRADEAHVPARPHGLLPRLVIRPAAARTLDEIVLDVASPYGPVIAVGRPDEELPPLGAARIYVRGGDWRETVNELCAAARLVVICMDASEGVNWELQQMLTSGHESKVVVLISPQLAEGDQRRLAERIFGETSTAPVVGGYVENGEVVLLTAPHLSRAAYRTALGVALERVAARSAAPPQSSAPVSSAARS